MWYKTLRPFGSWKHGLLVFGKQERGLTRMNAYEIIKSEEVMDALVAGDNVYYIKLGVVTSSASI